MYCGLSMKQSHSKSHAVCEDCERICFVFAFACGWQKPEDPQIVPHGWRRQYTGQYRESGISPLYLWIHHIKPGQLLVECILRYYSNLWEKKTKKKMKLRLILTIKWQSCIQFTHEWYQHSVNKMLFQIKWKLHFSS